MVSEVLVCMGGLQLWWCMQSHTTYFFVAVMFCLVVMVVCSALSNCVGSSKMRI